MKKNFIMIILKFLTYCSYLLTNEEKSTEYFCYPLKNIKFFKNNKYKLVRFFSYISPYLIFPYTLFAYVVMLALIISVLIAVIISEVFDSLSEKVFKFKSFWNEL